ncbi:MAG: DUF5686 family protein [Bacteroidetes bacterium]|nr:DUF5686 family protein [Bacteroidota bacterium]
MNWKLPALLVLLLLSQLNAFSQHHHISGRVTDTETGEPLAFVSLVVNNGLLGGYSDIDGKFKLRSPKEIKEIRVSYVGYQTKTIKVGRATEFLDIKMVKLNIELTEVVIMPKENPAHRIINRAIENRNLNDPSKLVSFSYTAYEKLIFTSDLDSISHADTIHQDSSMREIRKFFDNQYIGLIENVVRRSFRYPDYNFQRVVATKISGFQDPIFVFLLSQLQPVSFYEDVIDIGGQKLINPISAGSTSKYFFLIKDTIHSEERRDTTFVIYYRPLKRTNFEGLTGLLYINTDQYAIQNVIARPFREEGGLGIRIQQMYEKQDSLHWFPVQLNTDILFKSIEMDIGTDSVQKYHIVGKGRSYLKDIEINGQISKRKFSQVEIFVDPEAYQRDENYWEQFRIDSLNKREQRTYVFMDSIGKAEHLDRKARSIETMMTGRIPLGPVDLDMNKLFRYNGFEGTYLGLGMLTNRRLAHWVQLGGYVGYGLNDKTSKYGAKISFFPFPAHEVEARFAYYFDVRESAGVSLFDNNSIVLYERFRNFLINQMDYEENRQVSLSFRAMKYWKFFVVASQINRKSGFPYYFSLGEQPYNQPHETYKYGQISTGFRFAFKEKFLQNARTKISMGTNYPILLLQFDKGFKNWLDGEFDYERVDVKISKSFYIKYIGQFSLVVNAGLVNGAVPYNELYNGNGSFRQLTIYTPNSFATMRMNEFLSDRYASVFINHNFGKLLLRKKYFHPDVAMAVSAAFGSLKNRENHHLVNFKTMDKGYFESGLLLNDLFVVNFMKVGIGGYYRLGTYSYKDWQDNVSVKFSLLFPL